MPWLPTQSRPRRHKPACRVESGNHQHSLGFSACPRPRPPLPSQGFPPCFPRAFIYFPQKRHIPCSPAGTYLASQWPLWPSLAAGQGNTPGRRDIADARPLFRGHSWLGKTLPEGSRAAHYPHPSRGKQTAVRSLEEGHQPRPGAGSHTTQTQCPCALHRGVGVCFTPWPSEAASKNIQRTPRTDFL